MGGINVQAIIGSFDLYEICKEMRQYLFKCLIIYFKAVKDGK